MKVFGIEFLVFLVFVPAINANLLRGEAIFGAEGEWQEQPRELEPATDDTFIFLTREDGFATGQGDKVGADCSTDARRVFFVDGGTDEDYIDIVTSKWVRWKCVFGTIL